jgi:hypothetical protein
MVKEYECILSMANIACIENKKEFDQF